VKEGVAFWVIKKVLMIGFCLKAGEVELKLPEWVTWVEMLDWV